MTGDPQDFLARLRSLLPLRWFPDSAPVLDSVLSGFAEGWSWLHALLQAVRAQTRMLTATDLSLDLVARDWFGAAVARRYGETDDGLRARIVRERLRDRATRAAVAAVVRDLTGSAPVIFEPARAADTGAWGVALGYGVAGGWGSLAMPFQCLVTVRRPAGAGIAGLSGWNAPEAGWGAGPLAWGSQAAVQSQVSDADIDAAIAGTMAAGAIAWTRITN